MNARPESPALRPPGAARKPVFVTGSILRHVAVMTGTGSVGLVAIFVVDFLSLLYISWLGQPQATAGVGFATIVLFFAISINVGLMIGITALVARALGAGRREEARRLAASSLGWTGLAGLVVSILAWPLLPPLLTALGASGEAHDIALRFLHIVMPSNALMSLGMGLSGLLRAAGDARRAMYVTLSGGFVTAGLDPLLIFGLGLGVEGAAMATVISRLIFVAVGLRNAIRVHDLVGRPSLESAMADASPLFGIVGPAIMTNLATPVANAGVAAIMARFGDAAMAAVAIIDRVIPLAFGVLFALSGAVGPILGQNWGAGRFDRMRGTLTNSALLSAGYVLAVWLLLLLGAPLIAQAFRAPAATAEIVTVFTWFSGPLWFGLGSLYVANAAFNNLGFPLYSTGFNWGRATLGALPLAWLGATLDGPRGVLAGVALGAMIFGAAALWTAYRAIRRLERERPPA